MIKYFCSSDIHSFYDEWLDTLNIHGFDLTDSNHKIIICGDLFDRGEKSKECFEFVKKLADENRLIYIRGNHEDLLEDLVDNIYDMKRINSHHVSNGTVQTLASIMECSTYDILSRTFDWKVFEQRIHELVSFINKNSVDYYQLGNTIFVHGWVPTTCDNNKTLIVHENWRDGDWKEARWENGMEMFHFQIVPPDIETIVCGHWHTSFAWHTYEKQGPEWGNCAKFDEYIKYDPEISSRIVALDGCTAYTRKVNCVVFNNDGIIIDNKM